MTDLGGKVCVVTGGTRGLGRSTAEALAQMGATVVIHGRNADAVEKIARDIARSTSNANISGAVGSFDSLADVRRIAQEILIRHDRIDVLVNNAGAVTAKRKSTLDGLEWQIGVNHMAPFLLTNLLLDRMKATPSSRIVTVSSGAHRRGMLELDDLNWEHRRYDGLQAYGDSKLANILFTRELARRLEGTDVTAKCVHPGLVATNIFSGMGLIGQVFGLLARPWLLSAKKGAKTAIHVAASPEVAGITGEYFDKCEVARTAAAASNTQDARRLWELSEKLSGFADHEQKAI
jgi:retinol dehydrogenase-12